MTREQHMKLNIELAEKSCGDEKFGDAGTTDFLTGLMEQHEKMAWMLRAVLEEKNWRQANGKTHRPLTKGNEDEQIKMSSLRC